MANARKVNYKKLELHHVLKEDKADADAGDWACLYINNETCKVIPCTNNRYVQI